MTDREILDELIHQNEWWEKAVENCKKQLGEYQNELAKNKRLIELIRDKIEEK